MFKCILFFLFSVGTQNLFGASWSISKVADIYGRTNKLVSEKLIKQPDFESLAIYGYGGVESGDAEKFKRLLNSHPSIQLLVVTNLGGDTAETLEIAEIIQKRKMTVWVKGFCWSACAAHIFVAAENRILDGIIGLHGNPISAVNFDYLPQNTPSEYRESLEKFKKTFISSGRLDREKKLIELSGVSQTVFDYAQGGLEEYDRGNYSALVLSPEAMSKFRFRNITNLIDNYVEVTRMMQAIWGSDYKLFLY